MIRLQGVFAPITTPFSPSTGDVEFSILARNARRIAAADLAGLVLFGTTGEGPLLAEDERAVALEHVRPAVPDRLLLAAVWSESTRGAVRQARAAASAGADAILLAPPSYYRPQLTPEAVREHFVAVADASPLPVVIYQIPTGYSGIELKNGLVAELAQHGQIIGIKDSRGDLKALAELVEMCPRGFSVIVGTGTMLYAALEAGAAGGIVADANLVPEWCRDVFTLRANGEHTRAGEIQERLTLTSRGIVGAFGVPGVKAAMDLLGLPGGPPRAPLRMPHERERAGIREILERVGLRPVGVAS